MTGSVSEDVVEPAEAGAQGTAEASEASPKRRRWGLHRKDADAPRAPRVFEPRFDGVGLVVGALFIAASLDPSLLPRVPLVQGLATGVSFTLGYGLGAAGHGLWNYLQGPHLRGKAKSIVIWTLLGLIAVVLAIATWRWVGWQNEIRQNFGMDDLSPTAWFTVLGMGIGIVAVVLVIARSFRKLFRWAGHLLDRWLSRRLSVTLATTALALFLWSLVSGVLVDAFFSGANSAFSVKDVGTKKGVVNPESDLRSGGPGSLVTWDELGYQGRRFVFEGPSVDELNAVSGGGALEPIRAYVGLKSAPTVEERGKLLLDELVRTGAFDRKALVVTTTTGTGFLDARGVDPVEFLYNGDTAIAGLQYSYLPSWISLLADQKTVQDTSQASFRIIHEYWSKLPEDSRPELYLYGLSLGSYGVESVLGNINILNEPIDGALMSGPPFVNPLHKELTNARDAGSAAWMPIVGEGRTVRFTGREDYLSDPTGEWGDTRLVYLQHGSDPVVNFSPRMFFSEPEYLSGPTRSPDVSKNMSWFPLVTGWQTLLDLPASGSVPDGYGHMYTVTSNLTSWAAIMEPEGWTAQEVADLAVMLEKRQIEVYG